MPMQKAHQACRACRYITLRMRARLAWLTNSGFVQAIEEKVYERPTVVFVDQCVRLRKMCEYPGAVNMDSVTNPTVDGRLLHLEQLLNVNSLTPPETSASPSGDYVPVLQGPDEAFPSSFFLDSDFFLPVGQHVLARSSQSQLEQIALELFGGDCMTACSAYFSTVHTWLPMISRKRLTFDLNSNSRDDPCLMLLVLCMRLCVADTETQPKCLPAYTKARSLCSAAEVGGFVTLRLLQALVLLAVYELSHAVYPAAFLTISRAARLGILMGLHDRKNAPQLFKPAETWTLREEERRTWWAIFILDRFVNIETLGVPLAAPEPSQGELLPINDEDWENGRVVPSEPLYARSFTSVTTVGSFAKTCQAAHMLSVMRHREARKSAESATELLPEAQSLHQALSAMQSSLENGQTPEMLEMPALALCSSARPIMYNMYCCNEYIDLTCTGQPTALGTEMQRTGLEGIRTLASTVLRRLAKDESGCPFTAGFLYHAAAECKWFINEDHEQAIYDALEGIVGALRRLSGRWGVAGQYLSLLEQGDVLKFIPAEANISGSTATFGALA